MRDREELKRAGRDLRPTVQVGRSGFTKAVESEIDSQLERNELIKVKVLRSMGPASGWEDQLMGCVSRLGAFIVERKGGTVIIHRPSGSGPRKGPI